MKNMNSKVVLNKPRIKQLTNAQKTALLQTAEVVQDEIRNDEVIPMKSGNLRGESFFVDDSELNSGKVSLVHATPYARRLYYHPEYNFSKEYAANAKGKWFEDYENGGAKEQMIPDIFSKLYRRIANL